MVTATVLVAALASAPASAVKVKVVGLFKDRALLVIDGERRLLRAGDTSPEGVRLVSASSRGAEIEVDGAVRSVGLDATFGGHFAPPRETVVRIPRGSANRYDVIGSINGFPVDFVVDTGASVVALSGREARRLGIDYRLVGERAQAVTASGVAGTYMVRLDRVRVGDIELRDVEAAVIDGDYPLAVLLGMSFLERLELSRRNGFLELKLKR